MEEGIALYRRYLQGDGAALEALVARYSDALVRFAYCLLKDAYAAEDAAEDAFVALIVKKRAFSDDTNLRAYLYKTVRRERKRIPSPEFSEDPVLLAERRERNAILYAAMQKLPAQYGDVLYLVFLEGFRPEEAARILRRTKKQTYNLIARAKAALKEILAGQGVNYENL